MKTRDVIEYFGSAAAVARAVNISAAAVSQWGDRVPLGTAAILEKMTDGQLVLNPTEYPRRRPAAYQTQAT